MPQRAGTNPPDNSAATHRVLLNEKDIQKRVLELGEEISRDYEGLDPVLIAVLKGAVVFLADLVRAITIPHTFDFVGASSYGDATQTTGQVTITKDVGMDLAGRHVLVIEDVYDTGHTLAALKELLMIHRPASVELCCFVVKQCERVHDVPVRYAGFHLPDLFLVGYGLDYAERFRNLRHVAALDLG
jgi:hypoxanthine phosphoribosyltransferase